MRKLLALVVALAALAIPTQAMAALPTVTITSATATNADTSGGNSAWLTSYLELHSSATSSDSFGALFQVVDTADHSHIVAEWWPECQGQFPNLNSVCPLSMFSTSQDWAPYGVGSSNTFNAPPQGWPGTGGVCDNMTAGHTYETLVSVNDWTTSVDNPHPPTTLVDAVDGNQNYTYASLCPKTGVVPVTFTTPTKTITGGDLTNYPDLKITLTVHASGTTPNYFYPAWLFLQDNSGGTHVGWWCFNSPGQWWKTSQDKDWSATNVLYGYAGCGGGASPYACDSMVSGHTYQTDFRIDDVTQGAWSDDVYGGESISKDNTLCPPGLAKTNTITQAGTDKMPFTSMTVKTYELGTNTIKIWQKIYDINTSSYVTASNGDLFYSKSQGNAAHDSTINDTQQYTDGHSPWQHLACNYITAGHTFHPTRDVQELDSGGTVIWETGWVIGGTTLTKTQICG